jgi:hypothetical protein
MQKFGDLLARFMDGWSNDVRQRFSRQLDDLFPEVGLNHLIAVLFEMRVQVNLFRRHRFAFNDDFGLGLLGNRRNNLARFCSIVCPVNLTAKALNLRSEEFQILVEPLNGAFLDGPCFSP